MVTPPGASVAMALTVVLPGAGRPEAEAPGVTYFLEATAFAVAHCTAEASSGSISIYYSFFCLKVHH